MNLFRKVGIIFSRFFSRLVIEDGIRCWREEGYIYGDANENAQIKRNCRN